MKKKIYISFILAFIFSIYSCKKNENEIQPPSNLLENGPMSPELGKKINLGNYGNYTKYMGNVWGRNADELFVSTSSSGMLLRLIFSMNKVEVLESSGGIFTGKTNENGAVIFVGTINRSLGYHYYSFNTESIEGILSLSKDQATSLHVAQNHMFIYTGILGPPTNPCTSIWDWWCSSLPSVISSTFLYIDKETKQAMLLGEKRFTCFSRNSQNTLLSNPGTGMLFIFNNSLKEVTDSFYVSGWQAMSRDFYYGDFVKVAEVQIGTGTKDLIVIKHAVTNMEIERFTSSAKFLDDGVKWSEDGTKLIYAGATGMGSNTMIINMYDFLTKQEKTIATFSIGLGGGIPVSINELVLSCDNKKLLIKYGNDLYVKDV